MPLMRFRKDKGNEDEEVDALLGDDESAGMFMSTGAQAEAAADAEEPVAPDRPGPAVTVVTPQGAAPEATEEVPPEATAPVAEAPSADDPLSLFRSMQVVTEASGLTSDLEDVSVEELLAELREVRSMLPQAPAGGAE
jgi:hypothetical protein